MSISLDLEYISKIQWALVGFSWLQTNKVARFRCPICGDSKNNKFKKRAFLLANNGAFNFYCHNCGSSHSLYSFLSFKFPSIFDEYKVALFREKYGIGDRKSQQPILSNKALELFGDTPKNTHIEPLNLRCTPCSELPNTHPARVYLNSRKQNLSGLWYTDHFNQFASSVSSRYANVLDEPRIVIPFIDRDGKFLGYQGRAIYPKAQRYVTLKCDGVDDLIYGLDAVDFSKPVLVVEGALDARLLRNTIAVNGSSLTRIDKILSTTELSKCIFIFDNEPRNGSIVKLLDRCISYGYTVVVWPKDTPKDINKMLECGYTIQDIMAMIKEGKSSGMAAKLKLAKWKKVSL